MNENERRLAREQRLGWAALLLAAGMLLSFSGEIARHARLNVGFLRLNHALIPGGSETSVPAEIMFTRVLNDWPESERAWRGLAMAYLSQSRWQDAADAFRHVASVDVEVANAIEQAERAGDSDKLLSWYLIAAYLEPQDGDRWLLAAETADELDDPGTVTYYVKALEAPVRNGYLRGDVYLRLGALARQQSPVDWSSARAWYELAIAQNEFAGPNDLVTARMGLAEALDRLGHWRLALEEYRRVIEMSPGSYWPYVHGGRLIWYLEHDSAAAIDYLERAIAIDGTQKWAYWNLAGVYSDLEQPDLAIPLYRKVLELDPADRQAREQLDRLTGSDDG